MHFSVKNRDYDSGIQGFEKELFSIRVTVTHNELLLRDHCTSRYFKFKTYSCSSIYQRYQPLYLPNIIFLGFCLEPFLNLSIILVL
jgi:hypothetical protein